MSRKPAKREPKPVRFHQHHQFPVIIDLWGPGVDRRGKPTWSCTITGPGDVEIPGIGMGTWTRFRFGNGKVQIDPPPNVKSGEVF